MPTDRRFGRIKAVASLVKAAALIPRWLVTSKGSAAARRLEANFFSRILGGFGVAATQYGQDCAQSGTLYVTNHISWVDIPLLAAMLDADFVAKSDILRWPLLGRLARRMGPVFVARDERGSALTQNAVIRERLRSGRSIILCAEGTTSIGATVLPFKSCLFAAADAATSIQPLAIRYCAVDDAPLSAGRMREIAWIDDDDLWSGAMRVARQSTQAQVIFLPPIPAIPNRKLLADACWKMVAAGYAAAPKRSM